MKVPPQDCAYEEGGQLGTRLVPVTSFDWPAICHDRQVPEPRCTQREAIDALCAWVFVRGEGLDKAFARLRLLRLWFGPAPGPRRRVHKRLPLSRRHPAGRLAYRRRPPRGGKESFAGCRSRQDTPGWPFRCEHL